MKGWWYGEISGYKLCLTPIIKTAVESTRIFRVRYLIETILLSLFEAARWAPSSFNEQPWIFLFVSSSEPANYSRFLDCLADTNKIWRRLRRS